MISAIFTAATGLAVVFLVLVFVALAINQPWAALIMGVIVVWIVTHSLRSVRRRGTSLDERGPK